MARGGGWVVRGVVVAVAAERKTVTLIGKQPSTQFPPSPPPLPPAVVSLLPPKIQPYPRMAQTVIRNPKI